MTPGRLSDDEVVRRGRALYEEQVRHALLPSDAGKFVALDIDTGLYTIDESDVGALTRARAEHPHGTFYLVRIGSRAAYRVGVQRQGCSP